MFGMYNHKYVLITYQEQWGMGVYHVCIRMKYNLWMI